MKKLILMLTILVAGMVQAQTFDFACEPQFEGWTHTPVDIRTLVGDDDTTFNTTIIGPEYSFNYEGPTEGEFHLYTGVSRADWGTNISNGDYFLVKSSNSNFVIIKGKQITQGGRIIVDRTVYRNNNIFSWETHSGVLTIGKIADPVVIDNDFTHVPGVLQVGIFEFNTATPNGEQRFEYNTAAEVGNWRFSPHAIHAGRIFFYVSADDLSKYLWQAVVLVKQQDVTEVDDVWIGVVEISTIANGIGRVELSPRNLPSSWTLSADKPIQLGVIVRN